MCQLTVVAKSISLIDTHVGHCFDEDALVVLEFWHLIISVFLITIVNLKGLTPIIKVEACKSAKTSMFKPEFFRACNQSAHSVVEQTGALSMLV